MSAISIFISVLALALSVVTAWLTLLRRGGVRMTQPTVIFLGPDGRRSRDDGYLPKVYLRSLLFGTGKRGRIIEHMYVSLSRNEMRQNFNIWVYGDERLVRGSGLYVGETGVAVSHHFLAPKDSDEFRFSSGRYHLEVYAQLLGDKVPTPLFSQELEVTASEAESLSTTNAGIYFDWGPDSRRYSSHIDVRPPSASPEEFIKALLGSGDKPDQTAELAEDTR